MGYLFLMKIEDVHTMGENHRFHLVVDAITIKKSEFMTLMNSNTAT